GTDAEAQALAFESHVEPELLGRFEYSVAWDRAWHQAARGDDPDPARRSRIVDEVIIPAVDHDTTVLRAFRRWDMQLDPVDGLECVTSVIARAQQVKCLLKPTVPLTT